MGLLDPSAVQTADAATLLAPRYEILPFGKGPKEAAELGEPVRLTVTTSPKHGVDRSVEVVERLRGFGHAATLHLAARMVRSEEHLDEILERCADAGVDDLFVIGGDAPEPLGPFAAAGPVLELVAAHRLRPARLGVGAYPEGHPLIPQPELDASLAEKAQLADYLVTQLCFDPKALLRFVDAVRARGIALPLYAGAVGPIERRRLLEISAKIGVGPSLRYLRKQRGLMTLFRSPADTAVAFHAGIAPHVGEPGRGIAGFHWFTFNDLLGTRRWVEERGVAELGA
jgi:methylenetetrahydrofolate reductase (NADPH)